MGESTALVVTPKQLKAILKSAIKSRLPVLIKGAPGVGKTDIVYQAAEESGADVVVSHPVVDEPIDYKGLPAIIDKEAHFLPYGHLKTICSPDLERTLVYFMDDLGQAPGAVQAAGMQLLWSRRVNGHKVNDKVVFLAATNRKKDKAGVSGILEPVKGRFRTIIELVPDAEEWIDWAQNSGFNPILTNFIRWRPQLLFDFKPDNDMTNSPVPRTVASVNDWINSDLPQELEFPVIAGAAGEGFASEFKGFMKIYRSLPNIDKVLRDPDQADVPQDPATLYAICGAIANRVTEKNMEKVVRYSERIPSEFSVLMVRDCVKFKPEVADTDAFIQWATDNQDILM